MGGSVSSGRDNNELVDNLVDSGHIKSNHVERIFRDVDRGHFYLSTQRYTAYRDLAWRQGNLHLSAPCIYSEVLEALEIKDGCSFLNIGSGTGYLSTMVGLLIGAYGTNHNIEIHSDVIDYAKLKISKFVKNHKQFDNYDFCVPKFVHGNGLNLYINENTCLYDRVYVGAAVNNEYEAYFKSLLKINGILVLPLEDRLVKIIRQSEHEFAKKNIMTVSFASLLNENMALNTLKLPQVNALSLQELCRYKIRGILRKSIAIEHPNFYDCSNVTKASANKRKRSSSTSDMQSAMADISDTIRSPRLTESQFRLLIRGRLFNHIADDIDSDDGNNVDDEIEEADNADRSIDTIEETIEEVDDVTVSIANTISIPRSGTQNQSAWNSLSADESGYDMSNISSINSVDVHLPSTVGRNRSGTSSEYSSSCADDLPMSTGLGQQANLNKCENEQATVVNNEFQSKSHDPSTSYLSAHRDNILRRKILNLPIPQALQSYLLYHREV